MTVTTNPQPTCPSHALYAHIHGDFHQPSDQHSQTP